MISASYLLNSIHPSSSSPSNSNPTIMAPSWTHSLGCKSADDVHRPSLCCNSSDVLTIVPARKKKPQDTEPRPFLAITDCPFLPMHELPEGHSSRRAVEIIFLSGWTGYAASITSPEVEAVFDVHATPCADAAFEEARATSRAKAAAGHRCALDGNEIMRFQCRNVEYATGDVVCAAVATCRFCPAGVDTAVRTFDGSGAAHARVGGSAAGRRVMLLCRVIAGHVRHANDPADGDGDYDSVEMGNGELVVLDSHGVLPRYLVVYKVKPRPALQMSDSDKKACTLDQLVEYADAVTSA